MSAIQSLSLTPSLEVGLVGYLEQDPCDERGR